VDSAERSDPAPAPFSRDHDAGERPSARLVVGRLAPSPTGLLHLGNARSFLLAWLSVRSRGGRVLLRIEDIDGGRVRDGAVERQLEDLAWLGLDHDGEVLVQSSRTGVYDDAVERLVAAGRAYPCVCTRKEAAEAAASAPHETWQDAVPYPGTCRGLYASEAEARAKTGRDPAIRFRVDVDAVPFDDLVLGPQPGLVRGDFVIRRKDRGPAYQLAVVVDDAASGVTEVLRGDDLVVSTPRQMLLIEALDLGTPPAYAHVPLVLDAVGERLAKRHDATAMSWYREQGIAAEVLVGWIAGSSGLAPTTAPCRPEDLVPSFDLARLAREPLRLPDDLGVRLARL
jgi:glutamyl-tRNA synthetase